MNTDQFFDALELIDDRYLAEAMAAPKKQRRLKWIELAACLCTIFALAAILSFGLLPGGELPELPTVFATPSTEESTKAEPPPSTERPPSTEPVTTDPVATTEQPTEPSVSEPPTVSESVPPTVTEPTGSSATEPIGFPPSQPVIPSLICINGSLYQWVPEQSVDEAYTAELPLLGVIESQCSVDEPPDEHLETNEPLLGASVYEDGSQLIVVFAEQYRVYVPYTIS